MSTKKQASAHVGWMVDAIKGALASPLLLVSLGSRHASLSGELSLVVLVAGVLFEKNK